MASHSSSVVSLALPRSSSSTLTVAAAGAICADPVAAVPADDLVDRVTAGIVAERSEVRESVAVFCDGCLDAHDVCLGDASLIADD